MLLPLDADVQVSQLRHYNHARTVCPVMSTLRKTTSYAKANCMERDLNVVIKCCDQGISMRIGTMAC